MLQSDFQCVSKKVVQVSFFSSVQEVENMCLSVLKYVCVLFNKFVLKVI